MKLEHHPLLLLSHYLSRYFSLGFLDLCYCSRRCQSFLFYIIFPLFLSDCLSDSLSIYMSGSSDQEPDPDVVQRSVSVCLCACLSD